MDQKDKLELQDGNSQLVDDWIFSLIPVAVAFAFYVVFILQSGLANKNTFLAYGAAAGFIGVESFWIMKGFRLRRKRIIIMGLLGIVLTLMVLALVL